MPAYPTHTQKSQRDFTVSESDRYRSHSRPLHLSVEKTPHIPPHRPPHPPPPPKPQPHLPIPNQLLPSSPDTRAIRPQHRGHLVPFAAREAEFLEHKLHERGVVVCGPFVGAVIFFRAGGEGGKGGVGVDGGWGGRRDGEGEGSVVRGEGGRVGGCSCGGGGGGSAMPTLRHRLERVEIIAFETEGDAGRRDALALRRRRCLVTITLLRMEVLLVLGSIFLVGGTATLVHSARDRAPFLYFCVRDARMGEGGAEPRGVRGGLAGRFWLDAEVGVEGAACVEDVGGEVGGRGGGRCGGCGCEGWEAVERRTGACVAWEGGGEEHRCWYVWWRCRRWFW